MKPPIKYFGGKSTLVSKLIPLFPPHTTYVETCGGSGALLFAKKPVKVEFYNDLNSELFNFMRVLRDDGCRLRQRLELTLYARDEHALAQEAVSADDPVERAARFYVDVMQGINGQQHGSFSRCFGTNRASSFYNSVSRLTALARRLRSVQIEHKDCVPLIADLDGPHTLFYVDPPYMHDTRTSKSSYQHEMTAEDHVRLLEILLNIEGMAVISGYPGDLYDSMLADWEKREFEVNAYADVKYRKDGSARSTKTECVWRNPAAVAAADKMLTLRRDIFEDDD